MSAAALVTQVQQGEQLLEELVDIVEGIDSARDLQTIGGLPTLRKLASAQAAGLRWRALDVLAACCSNNPAVQVRGHIARRGRAAPEHHRSP